MSGVWTYAVECDGPDCTSRIGGLINIGREKVRKQALADGWVRASLRDFCPYCVKQFPAFVTSSAALLKATGETK